MLYFVVFVIGFLLSGIWFAAGLLLFRIQKNKKALMWKPLLSAILPTVVIWLLIGDHPFHIEGLIDWRVWGITAVTVAATCVIMLLTPQAVDLNAQPDWNAAYLFNCVDGACMEISQRAMMQAFVFWLLAKWSPDPAACVLINALIWCADTLFQAFVIQKSRRSSCWFWSCSPPLSSLWGSAMFFMPRTASSFPRRRTS